MKHRYCFLRFLSIYALVLLLHLSTWAGDLPKVQKVDAIQIDKEHFTHSEQLGGIGKLPKYDLHNRFFHRTIDTEGKSKLGSSVSVQKRTPQPLNPQQPLQPQQSQHLQHPLKPQVPPFNPLHDEQTYPLKRPLQVDAAATKPLSIQQTGKRKAVPPQDDAFSKVYKGVVKIFVDADFPSFSIPWQTSFMQASVGSGFIISGRRILTNAHVISPYSTRILIRKYGSTERFPAVVLALGDDSDLALLTVHEERFWKDVHTLEFTGIPNLQESVAVVGYPTGGDQISITKGIVSRVGMSTYEHSGFSLLTVQIDAAINPGNSGGPAFVDNKVAGIAFQGFNELQNMGFILPVPLIKQFLRDLSVHCMYTGTPDLGVSCQPMENAGMQQFFGMRGIETAGVNNSSGILVTNVDELRITEFKKGLKRRCGAERKQRQKKSYQATCELKGITMELDDTLGAESTNNITEVGCSIAESDDSIGFHIGDAIMEISGFEVATDGTVEFRDMERVDYRYSIMDKFSNELVAAKVLRKGEVKSILVPLMRPNPIVPLHTWNMKPSYFVFGGLVFTTLTRTLIAERFGKDLSQVPISISKYFQRTKYKQFEGQEIVILLEVLADELTVGYEFMPSVVAFAEGKRVENLKQLIELLEDPSNSKSTFTVFEIEAGDDSLIPIILNRAKAIASGPSILKEHHIQSDRFL